MEFRALDGERMSKTNEQVSKYLAISLASYLSNHRFQLSRQSAFDCLVDQELFVITGNRGAWMWCAVSILGLGGASYIEWCHTHARFHPWSRVYNRSYKLFPTSVSTLGYYLHYQYQRHVFSWLYKCRLFAWSESQVSGRSMASPCVVIHLHI